MMIDKDTIVLKSTSENFHAERALGKNWTFRAMTDKEWAIVMSEHQSHQLKKIRIELCDNGGNILGESFTRVLSGQPWHVGWMMGTNYVVLGWIP